MILTDTLITIDSRLILTDIYLWTFQMLTVFFSVCAAASKTPFSQVNPIPPYLYFFCTQFSKYVQHRNYFRF